MNILTTTLEYQMTFHIVPQVTLRLGKSWGVTLNWLNFSAEIKHISTDFGSKHTYIFSPFVTLQSYPDSAYRLTFEFNWLGYTFRRGICLHDGEEPRPVDNTPGFVTSEWFAQSRKEHDLAEELEKMWTAFTTCWKSGKKNWKKNDENFMLATKERVVRND